MTEQVLEETPTATDDEVRAAPLQSGKAQADFARAWEGIRRLGLEKHVAELEAVGYTVIPPEKLATPAFLTRLRGAFCATVERRTGIALDLERTGALDGQGAGAWAPFTFLLFEDPVFQEAILNPVPLALADYTVGRSCMFSTCIGLVKGPGDAPLGLHTDNGALAVPAPYPAYPLLLNCTWVLTDYTKSGGALCLVPGSHTLGHGPRGDEVAQPTAIEAPAGSMVVWSGSIWHGSYPRRDPGLRLTLVTIYTRPFVIPQERYREEVTQEILDANPPRFAELMGKNVYQYSFKEEGYDLNKVALTAGKSWWD